MPGIRMTIKPKPAHVSEVRELMKDWVTHRQGQGDRVNLLEQVWGATGATFTTTSLADTFDELGEYRKKRGQDPKTVEDVKRLGMLEREPWESRIVDVLVRPPQAGSPPKFWVNATLRPRTECIGDTRNLLVRWTASRIELGERMVLVTDVWGGTGAAFTGMLAYSSIGEAEQHREKVINSPEFAELSRTLAPMLRVPTEWNLHQVLIPMNLK